METFQVFFRLKRFHHFPTGYKAVEKGRQRQNTFLRKVIFSSACYKNTIAAKNYPTFGKSFINEQIKCVKFVEHQLNSASTNT